jgi:hypothetical protein
MKILKSLIENYTAIFKDSPNITYHNNVINCAYGEYIRINLIKM